MSGTVGIFNRGGAPIENQVLDRMTMSLAYRGPDGQRIWLDGAVGLGCTTLQTADRPTLQPAHLGSLFITADMRLDSIADLKRRLEDAGKSLEPSAADPILVLHAYSVWGPRCVEYLRGDFSFGIWDAASKTLFCARDHFGIKPFYYAVSDDVFFFSNTLNCLRQYSGVTRELNESAVGDFLLFGLNYDNATTIFRDIQRLAPAHSLTVSCNALEVTRYWSPPTDRRVHYPRRGDYIDQFDELLRSAVSDRLSYDQVGILLSGGLDSGSVAAVAQEISTANAGHPKLRSYTVGYDSLFRDDEGARACEVSTYLRIPNEYLPLDDIQLFQSWDDPDFAFPEPSDNPLSAGLFKQFQMIAKECRVALSGEGADNLMYFQMWPYLQDLRKSGKWKEWITDGARFVWVRQFPWLGLTRRVQSFFRAGNDLKFPQWINPEFAKRAGLVERWKENVRLAIPPIPHAARPKAHASMFLPHWTTMFESQDPGVTRSPVEVRYPFLDLRMVDFLLAIPAFPWLYKKTLIRKSMAARLPDSIRLRPKTPLQSDPVAIKLNQFQIGWARKQRWTQQLGEFVDPSMIEPFHDRMKPEQFRPLYLDTWLQGIR